MRSPERYEARKAQREAQEQRKRDSAEQTKRDATLSRVRFWRHPDRLVRYAGWLQAYTLVLSLATIALFAATVISAIILSRTDSAIHAQLAEMRAEHRPWVKADIEFGGVTWKGRNANILTRLILQNTGQVPGTSVEIIPHAMVSFDFGEILKKQKELGAQAQKHPNSIGQAVFPGDKEPFGYTIGLAEQEISRFDEGMKKINPKSEPSQSIPVALIFIIDYVFPASTDHGQTGYVIMLYWKDPAYPEAQGMSIPIGKTLSGSDLRPSYFPLGQYAH